MSAAARRRSAAGTRGLTADAEPRNPESAERRGSPGGAVTYHGGFTVFLDEVVYTHNKSETPGQRGAIVLGGCSYYMLVVNGLSCRSSSSGGGGE